MVRHKEEIYFLVKNLLLYVLYNWGFKSQRPISKSVIICWWSSSWEGKKEQIIPQLDLVTLLI